MWGAHHQSHMASPATEEEPGAGQVGGHRLGVLGWTLNCTTEWRPWERVEGGLLCKVPHIEPWALSVKWGQELPTHGVVL